MTGRYFLENVRLCEKCGKIEVNAERTEKWRPHLNIRNAQYITHYFCPECAESMPHCESCQSILYPGETTYRVHNDPRNPASVETICRRCRSVGSFSACNQCHETYNRNEFEWYSVSDSDGDATEYCPSCVESHRVSQCSSCGCVLSYPGEDIDGEIYCLSCARSLAANRMGELHMYNYMPKLKMEGPEDSLFIGFELEIDNGPRPSELIKKIYEIDHESFYCKGDGSLNNGIEIVSHPKTLEQWKDSEPTLKKILNLCSNTGWQSHDCDTCGLHFHFARGGIRKLSEGFRCLSNGTMEKTDNSDASIMRMIYLYEKYRRNFINFARRGREAERWAGSWEDSVGTNYDEFLKSKPTQDRLKMRARDRNYRYKAVNLNPANTIEFRIFRGTLILDTFYASMQLSDNVVRLCCAKDNEEIQNVTFQDIVEFCHYDTLTDYAKERGAF